MRGHGLEGLQQVRILAWREETDEHLIRAQQALFVAFRSTHFQDYIRLRPDVTRRAENLTSRGFISLI